MSHRLLLSVALAFAALGSGCVQDRPAWTGAVPSTDSLPVSAGHQSPASPVDGVSLAPRGFATAPDRGRLVEYPTARPVRKEGAFDWHQVNVSEEHAIAAVVNGRLEVVTPDGEQLAYRYQRYTEHKNGNWTWFGKLATGEDAIITFGDRAAFGRLGRPGLPPIELTSLDGVAWLGVPDPLTYGHYEVQGDSADGRAPPSGDLEPEAFPSPRAAAESIQAAAVTTTVDLLVGYTTGFTTKWGGRSQALTRLQNRIDITNQAYLNSGVNAQIRLVRAIQVNYSDATSNDTTLDELSANGVSTPASLLPLRQGRETYGADLVSLIRPYQRATHESCGVAWISGYNQTSIDSSDAKWGYSVVSDGTDGSYFCRNETMAHELGHNMGQMHNTEDSGGDFGAHAYSFGYREAASNGFYTVMAYRLPSSSQYPIVNFGNPQVSVDGRVTGTAAADSARSLNQTMPLIAQFRAQVTLFADVPSGYWAYNYIESLYDAGVTTGCALNLRRYCPTDIVNRDQMAVFLLRAKYGAGYLPPAASGTFSDVPAFHWAASWIERVYAEGITTGCQSSPLAYCPNTAVSRDQMAVFLLRAKYGSAYTPPAASGVFADVPASYWAAAWIEQLAAEGISNGCATSPLRFCPSSSVTRDQMAVFLTKAFNLP